MGWACSASSMAPNTRVFNGSSAMGEHSVDSNRPEVGTKIDVDVTQSDGGVWW